MFSLRVTVEALVLIVSAIIVLAIGCSLALHLLILKFQDRTDFIDDEKYCKNRNHQTDCLISKCVKPQSPGRKQNFYRTKRRSFATSINRQTIEPQNYHHISQLSHPKNHTLSNSNTNHTNYIEIALSNENEEFEESTNNNCEDGDFDFEDECGDFGENYDNHLIQNDRNDGYKCHDVRY